MNPVVILSVVGGSSIAAVATAVTALINERFRHHVVQQASVTPHGEIKIVTFTDSDGNTFQVTPTKSEGKLVEKLYEEHAAADQDAENRNNDK
jgi:hypothetical protein